MSSVLAGSRFIETIDLKDKRVFLRLDLNLPLLNGQITDLTRLKAAIPTIKYCLDKGAKLVLGSHLGRPKTEEHRSTLSLEPIAKACLLYTSPSPRDQRGARMPSSA